MTFTVSGLPIVFFPLPSFINPVFAFVSGQLLTVRLHINEFVCKITEKMFLSFLQKFILGSLKVAFIQPCISSPWIPFPGSSGSLMHGNYMLFLALPCQIRPLAKSNFVSNSDLCIVNHCPHWWLFESKFRFYGLP